MTRLLKLATAIAALATTVVGQNSTRYCEESTGICYSSYVNDDGIYYRVALPDNSTTSDAILEIVSPVKYNWAGLAWGGHMTANPLTVAWPNGTGVVVSSRAAAAYGTVPQPFDGAEYTYLKGTGVNKTHWTLTVRCKGCTRWTLFDSPFAVDGGNETDLAFAYSSVPVDNPASNTSSFHMHEVHGSWVHNLTMAKTSTSEYNGWVTSNALPVLE